MPNTLPLQIAALGTFILFMALFSLPRMVEHSEKQAKIQQEQVYVARR